MNATQIAVILFGLVAGYGLVSMLASSVKPHSKSGPADTSQRDDAGGAWKNADAMRYDEGLPWYVVLNVDQRATVDEIRLAYKGLISQYHPDKVATMGVELRQLAELKTKRITEAYRDAMLMKRSRA